MRIHRNDISDILKSLPSLERYDASQSYDVLICTLGFEYRTHEIVDRLAKNNLLSRTELLLLNYPTNQEDNKTNLGFFEKAKEQAKGFHTIVYEPKQYFLEISNLFKHKLCLDGKSVAFDISTCSSYLLYPTLKALLDCDITLVVLYSEAESYFPSWDEWKTVAEKAEAELTLYAQSFENAEFQSSGVENIYSSTLFSEMNPGNHPSILIAVPNFSAMRMNAIIQRDKEINKTSFGDIVWLLGDPPKDENKWRLDAVRKTNNLTNSDIHKISPVDTLDYRSTLQILEDLWLRYRYDYHISIGSLGSKMQHLGTLIFLYLHQDVGLWLTEPVKFQAKLYSNGVGELHKIVFGSTKAFRENIAQYQIFKWQF